MGISVRAPSHQRDADADLILVESQRLILQHQPLAIPQPASESILFDAGVSIPDDGGERGSGRIAAVWGTTNAGIGGVI